jgi:hypothetical protein
MARRKALTTEEINNLLSVTPYSESEGEDFGINEDSEDEYIPCNNLSSDSEVENIKEIEPIEATPQCAKSNASTSAAAQGLYVCHFTCLCTTYILFVYIINVILCNLDV